MDQKRLPIRNEGGKPYIHRGHTVGLPSWNWETFILFRREQDLNIFMHPKTIGISTSILKDLIEHKTKMIIVQIDGKARYKVNPRKWLEEATIDKLTKKQEPHAFLDLEKFKAFK